MCKHLYLILGRFFPWIIAVLEKLHKGQGQHRGSGKAHYGHRKKDNGLKIPEIIEKGSGQVRKEIRIDLRAVKSKENGKQHRGDKTYRNTRRKALSISELPAQFKLVILDGLIDSKPRDNPIEKAVKNIGVQVKKGKDQKVGDKASTGGKTKPHG